MKGLVLMEKKNVLDQSSHSGEPDENLQYSVESTLRLLMTSSSILVRSIKLVVGHSQVSATRPFA